MSWIPYLSMAGRVKKNLPTGSLKYLFVYFEVRVFRYGTIRCFDLLRTCLSSTSKVQTHTIPLDTGLTSRPVESKLMKSMAVGASRVPANNPKQSAEMQRPMICALKSSFPMLNDAPCQRMICSVS